jgi:hypothetical protein
VIIEILPLLAVVSVEFVVGVEILELKTALLLPSLLKVLFGVETANAAFKSSIGSFISNSKNSPAENKSDTRKIPVIKVNTILYTIYLLDNTMLCIVREKYLYFFEKSLKSNILIFFDSIFVLLYDIICTEIHRHFIVDSNLGGCNIQ